MPSACRAVVIHLFCSLLAQLNALLLINQMLTKKTFLELAELCWHAGTEKLAAAH